MTAVIVVGLFVGSSPGDDASDDTTSTDATTCIADVATSTPADDSTTTVSPPAATEASAGESLPGDSLPGEIIDLYPYEGASLAVVGVERDDTLAVRSGPGDDFDVVVELSPLDTEVIATGHNRQVDQGAIWAEVDKDGQRGWAPTAFLLQMGVSDDITGDLADSKGQLPSGATMDDVATAVAELRASTEPPSRIAIIEDPEIGDLGSITVDVIGLGDDALGGERLHILAEPCEGTEGFVVQSVQRLSLCSRGVTDDGLCV